MVMVHHRDPPFFRWGIILLKSPIGSKVKPGKQEHEKTDKWFHDHPDNRKSGQITEKNETKQYLGTIRLDLQYQIRIFFHQIS